MMRKLLFGERSLTVLAATFGDEFHADHAAQALKSSLPAVGQVMTVGPCTPRPERALEPEQAGIWHTALRSHALLGLLGALAGAAAAWLAHLAGWPAVVSSPGVAVTFLAALGGFAGLLLAGLVTLRPDHARVAGKVLASLKRGQWAVIVHPRDADQRALAQRQLTGQGGTLFRSL